MTSLIANAWVSALGAALVHFLWEGAAVAAVLAALQPRLRRVPARVRYGWSCLALFSLAPIFVATLIWEHGSAAAWSWTPLEQLAPRILPYVVAGWVLGVVVLSARALGGWWVVRRIRRGVVRSVPAEWRRSLADLRARLGVAVEVGLGLSAKVAGPCVVGWWRPLVLLPLSAATAIAPEQLEALLAHELAHIRRHDYLVNLLQRAVEVVLFYHPAVWWISRQIEQERENCCDDEAVAACGDPVAYARALVDWAGMPQPELACAAAGGVLRRRVLRIIGVPAPKGRRRFGAAAAIALAALVGVAMLRAPAPVALRVPKVFVQHASLRLPPPSPPMPRRAPKPVERAAAMRIATAPPPQPQVQRQIVTVTFAAVETCVPQLEWVRHVSPDGREWVDLEPVMGCAPVLQPTGVWVSNL